MGLDIIIYAVVAAVLIGRLWSVLGRRNDEDQQRPNPFIARPAPKEKEDEKPIAMLPQRSEAMNVFQPLSVAPASLLGALEQIKKLDPTFDEKQFHQGARQAFTMIIEDFAKGDLSRLTRLLGPRVLPNFQNAIEARRNANQTMESKVLRIKDIETTAARVEGTTAIITVRFVSEQENTLRDAAGQVIGGDAGVIEEVTDIWVFARDTTANDPNWMLVETHA
ncbi:MAG: Tim44/TimA family putative adaptor protein [Alphaproteobacteria bacterium]